jgi:hypothetical protein
MKTTIDLPDPLFREAKATAAANGQTLKSFITDSVRQRLNEQESDWRAVLKNLPRVDKETADEIMQSVDDYDAIDLEFQKQAMKSENAR